ncbi:hypothetical protein CVIRNUC_003449 [Coccomyxa viridis]|uniref:DUF3431 domain containing protein n=1 Tax=Coccomyxa viridis TaxID=1274662 RepID=A0AAV1I2Z4_9CHLO|nr:hypothetical protein CVIRNUC_003449 [Coccomyxa viridis]
MSNDTVLVVARYKEDLAWLEKVPDGIDVIVYNKGPDTPTVPRAEIVPLPNIGREADTYCQHIIRNYTRLHKRTIFSQGDPFTHSPDFLKALEARPTWSDFQPLTTRYLEDPPIPPASVLDLHGQSGPGYTERISCFTLDSIYFNDTEVISFNYAAIFCVDSRIISQHARSIYKNIVAKLGSNHWVEASICERMWMLLFDANSALKIPER